MLKWTWNKSESEKVHGVVTGAYPYWVLPIHLQSESEKSRVTLPLVKGKAARGTFGETSFRNDWKSGNFVNLHPEKSLRDLEKSEVRMESEKLKLQGEALETETLESAKTETSEEEGFFESESDEGMIVPLEEMVGQINVTNESVSQPDDVIETVCESELLAGDKPAEGSEVNTTDHQVVVGQTEQGVTLNTGEATPGTVETFKLQKVSEVKGKFWQKRRLRKQRKAEEMGKAQSKVDPEGISKAVDSLQLNQLDTGDSETISDQPHMLEGLDGKFGDCIPKATCERATKVKTIELGQLSSKENKQKGSETDGVFEACIRTETFKCPKCQTRVETCLSLAHVGVNVCHVANWTSKRARRKNSRKDPEIMGDCDSERCS